jgi:hypothetical protein
MRARRHLLALPPPRAKRAEVDCDIIECKKCVLINLWNFERDFGSSGGY